jgi:hypothetical protein
VQAVNAKVTGIRHAVSVKEDGKRGRIAHRLIYMVELEYSHTVWVGTGHVRSIMLHLGFVSHVASNTNASEYEKSLESCYECDDAQSTARPTYEDRLVNHASVNNER